MNCIYIDKILNILGFHGSWASMVIDKQIQPQRDQNMRCIVKTLIIASVLIFIIIHK